LIELILASYLLVSFIEQPNSYWNQKNNQKTQDLKMLIFPLFTCFLIRQSLKHALKFDLHKYLLARGKSKFVVNHHFAKQDNFIVQLFSTVSVFIQSGKVP
jgi:hypothetical protein